jgi:cardiolipin synthase
MENLLKPTGQSLWHYVLAIVGVVLALFAVARLMSEKRQPGNTVAWLLAILLIPWVGVPLFLLFGGRKLRRLAERKSRLYPVRLGPAPDVTCTVKEPTAQIAESNGAGPPVGGNTVRLLTTGEQAFAVLEEQIRAARHSIHITAFILARDEVGKRLIRLLAERARHGIKVRLLLDAVGCMFSSYGFCNPLRAAMVGGHNLAREYMGPTPIRNRWRDFGAVITGPAAGLLNEVFLADWTFACGQLPDALHRDPLPELLPLEGTSEVQVVASGPDVAGDALYEAILSMIQEAQRSIWIVTPYFIPDEVLLRSLVVKARAGCEVTLILPARSNHPVTDFARRYYVWELQRAGVRVRLHGPGMMHSKAMIVDDRIGLLGSANFDLRSLFVNFEIGVLLYSETDVRANPACYAPRNTASSATSPRNSAGCSPPCCRTSVLTASDRSLERERVET